MPQPLDRLLAEIRACRVCRTRTPGYAVGA